MCRRASRRGKLRNVAKEVPAEKEHRHSGSVILPRRKVAGKATSLARQAKSGRNCEGGQVGAAFPRIPKASSGPVSCARRSQAGHEAARPSATNFGSAEGSRSNWAGPHSTGNLVSMVAFEFELRAHADLPVGGNEDEAAPAEALDKCLDSRYSFWKLPGQNDTLAEKRGQNVMARHSVSAYVSRQ